MTRGIRSGFTLIELLIVIAIIAILALIAIPNFIEAQTRSKVARAQADMRSIGTAIEAYTVDYNRPPIGLHENSSLASDLGIPNMGSSRYHFKQMTTPVAYLTSIPEDPFTPGDEHFHYNPGAGRPEPTTTFQYRTYQWVLSPPFSTSGLPDYTTNLPSHLYAIAAWRGYMWSLSSPGPAKMLGGGPGGLYPYTVTILGRGYCVNIYDPTNGTISRGYIIRTNKGAYGPSEFKNQ